MPGLDQLRGLPDTELIEKHDSVLEKATRTGVPTVDRQYLTNVARIYADELTRREYARQGERMEALTRSMNRPSVVAAIATITGVLLTAMSLIFGG